ncbi:hypothetical protein HDV04_001524 [Boothiomyces sp. JEL0838]|nr:hypothetical protein HDV04_001524 [Boothiomyces sp. JEL0838]
MTVTLGPCCVEGYLWNGTPSGSEIQLGELGCYVALPQIQKQTNTAILYIHDIFGFQAKNARLLCDRMASQSGIPVYMPDFFDGKCVGEPGNLKYELMEFVRMFPTQDNMKRVQDALDSLKALGKTNVGAIGYCWGGKYSLHFGKLGLKASAAAHPSLLEPEKDLAGITVPVLLLLAEKDQMFNPIKQESLQILGKGPGLKVIDFPGTVHGFAVRGDEETVREARDKACSDAASFFDLHLNQ